MARPQTDLDSGREELLELMVGLIEDTRKIVTHGFKTAGDIIAVLGITGDDLSASEYAQTVLGLSTAEIIENGIVPHVDLTLERKVQDTLLSLIDKCLIHSAHDCSEGGLAVTIAECCFSSLGRKALGAEIKLSNNELSPEAILFGETPSRIVVSFAPEHLERVKAIAGDCPFEVIGKVGGSDLSIAVNDQTASSRVSELEAAWRDSLKNRLEN